MVCCYFFMATYLLVSETLLDKYPSVLKYVLVAIIFSYGAFRAVRIFREKKDADNEIEE